MNTPIQPKKNSRLQRFIKQLKKVVIIGIVLAIAYWAWKSYGNMLTGEGVIEGKIVHPSQKIVSNKIITECEIKARTEKEYSYPEIAKIEKLSFRVGSQVKKGDLLVTLSSDAINQKYSTAQKDLADSKATLTNMQEDVRSSKLLYQKDLESQSSFIEKKKNFEKFKSDKYRQALATYQQASKDREKLRIYADFDGYITEQNKFNGDLVVKDEPIMTVSRIDNLFARFYISKIYRNNVREGLIVTYYDANDKSFSHPVGTGKITLVSDFIAKKGIMVEMEFVPADKSDLSKFLNQNLLTVIQTSATPQPVLSIPIGAVYSDDTGYFVYAIDNGKTTRVDVKLGLIGYEDVELKSGIDSNRSLLSEPKIYPSGGMAFKKRAD